MLRRAINSLNNVKRTITNRSDFMIPIASSLIRSLATMASSLAKVPEVDIDATGVFKYILIKLNSSPSGDKGEEKLLVRGYAECNYHTDINDIVMEELQSLKEKGELPEWTAKVLGGGRIVHDSSQKTIKVYGHSQGYGKADHETTVSLLKKVYSDYDISCSDEGY